MANFEQRDGKKERWSMMGGNTLWIGSDQVIIIDMIYEYMLKNTTDTKKQFSTSEIAKGVKKHPTTVATALAKIMFKAQPYVRCIAMKYPIGNHKIRTVHKYQLIRKAEDDS